MATAPAKARNNCSHGRFDLKLWVPARIKKALGTNVITLPVSKILRKNTFFSSPEEVRVAYDQSEINIHDEISIILNGEKLETTVGRLGFH